MAIWRAYFKMEPFGSVRGDMQAGIVANMILAKAGVKPRKAKDWILDESEFEDEKPQDWRHMKAYAKAYANVESEKKRIAERRAEVKKEKQKRRKG